MPVAVRPGCCYSDLNAFVGFRNASRLRVVAKQAVRVQPAFQTLKQSGFGGFQTVPLHLCAHLRGRKRWLVRAADDGSGRLTHRIENRKNRKNSLTKIAQHPQPILIRFKEFHGNSSSSP